MAALNFLATAGHGRSLPEISCCSDLLRQGRRVVAWHCHKSAQEAADRRQLLRLPTTTSRRASLASERAAMRRRRPVGVKQEVACLRPDVVCWLGNGWCMDQVGAKIQCPCGCCDHGTEE